MILISSFRKELHLAVLICAGFQNSCKICTNSPFSVTTIGEFGKNLCSRTFVGPS